MPKFDQTCFRLSKAPTKLSSDVTQKEDGSQKVQGLITDAPKWCILGSKPKFHRSRPRNSNSNFSDR